MPGRKAARKNVDRGGERQNVGAVEGVVLGVDPGTRVLGYGAILPSRRLSLRSAGVIRVRANDDLPSRLAGIAREFRELLAELRPSVVVVERAFVGKNIQSALRIGEARGVVMSLASEAGARVAEITPAEAKRAIVGTGAADKEQVAAMVLRELGLQDPGGPRDATDALAVALAFLHGDRLRNSALAAAVPRRGRGGAGR